MDNQTEPRKKWLTPDLASRLITLLCQILVVEYGVGFAAWYMMADGLKDKSGTPLGADFLNVYAAGTMALRGRADQIYDWGLHGQVEQSIAGYNAPYFGWHYPPIFLGLAALLALLPYLWALALYLTASFAAYWAVLRRIAPRMRAALWAVAAFPGVFTNVSNGQNGFITTALFGMGLTALEENPWMAGFAFGLLSYKPQFFMAIPLMLIAGRQWRALGATIFTACAGIGLSWIAFGASTWQAFFGSRLLTQHVILEQGSTGWQKIQSVFSLARMWGGSIETAYILQTAVAILTLGTALWIWRRQTSLATRAGALCAALMLSTPYLLDYDLVMLAVPISFLARQGIETGFRPYEKLLLATLWLLPLLARALGTHHMLVTPFASIALLLVCLNRAKEEIENPLP